jgi:hypothetical protein
VQESVLLFVAEYAVLAKIRLWTIIANSSLNWLINGEKMMKLPIQSQPIVRKFNRTKITNIGIVLSQDCETDCRTRCVKKFLEFPFGGTIEVYEKAMCVCTANCMESNCPELLTARHNCDEIFF